MTPSLERARLAGAVAVTPRPLAAYRDMFLLTDDDLRAGPILDCPAGASPFGGAPGGLQLELPRLARGAGPEVDGGARGVRRRLPPGRLPLRGRDATAPPVPDDRFALTLSGFLLFVYPELFGQAELLAALMELARVTRGEVRVFPVHSSSGEPYAELAALRAALDARGVDTELREAGCAYATTPGSDLMLVCARRPATSGRTRGA